MNFKIMLKLWDIVGMLTIEITSVHMHANVCAAFSDQSHINGEKKIMNCQEVVININMQKLSTVRLMSKNRQHLLNEGKLIKRKKHGKLTSKDMQKLLNKEKILKREKHWRLMSKEKLNLQKEEKSISL